MLIAVIVVGVIGARAGVLKFTITPSKQATPSPSTSPSAPPKLIQAEQKGPYTFVPSADLKELHVPSFTLTPPSGWLRTLPNVSTGQMVRFISPDEDAQKVKDGLMYSSRAGIFVKVAGSYSSLDDFVSQFQSSTSRMEESKTLAAQPLTLNGEKGYMLEFRYKQTKESMFTHEINYLFYKNGLSFIVETEVEDSAWEKRRDSVQTALNTFRFL